MIIVEGTDLVGKTTLVRALVKRLNELGESHIPLPLSKLPESFDKYTDYIPLMNPNVVWDRFYLSRQAYGQALQNQETLSAAGLQTLDAWTTLHCGFVVLCIAERGGDNHNRFLADQWAKCDQSKEMYRFTEIVQVNNEFIRLSDSGVCKVDYPIVSNGERWPSQFANDIVDQYLDRRHEQERTGLVFNTKGKHRATINA